VLRRSPWYPLTKMRHWLWMRGRNWTSRYISA
jgi:hypothetical protein